MKSLTSLRDRDIFSEPDDALAFIREVLDRANADELEAIKEQEFDFAEFTDATWVHYLAYHNQPELLAQVLALGFDQNAYAKLEKENEGMSYISPLMVAVGKNAIPAAHCLLERGAKLAGFINGNYNVLYLAAKHTSYEFVEALLQHAKKTNQIDDLVSLCHFHHGQMYDVPSSYQHIADNLIQDFLLKKIKYFKLSYLTDLSQGITDQFARHYEAPKLQDIGIQDANEQETFGKAPDKKTALKNALIIIYETMHRPDWCCHYLKALEKEIIKEANGFLPSKHLSQSYQKKMHMGYEIIVPNADFKPLKLNSLLKRAILNILQPFGLGESAVKLLGLIPIEIMMGIISNGEYFSESSKTDPKLLIHGKVSHMFQYLIVCLMVIAGDIHLEYGDNQTLTIKDIFSAMVHEPKSFVNLKKDETTTLWEQIFDSLYLNRYTFQDPYRLNSLLMNAAYTQLPELAACLINGHCKAMIGVAQYYSLMFQEVISVQLLWNNMIRLVPFNELYQFNAKDYLDTQTKHPAIKFPQNITANTNFLVLYKYPTVKPTNDLNHTTIKEPCAVQAKA